MIFNGKEESKKILDILRTEVSNLPFVPEFSDILVGHDGPSIRYVNKKKQVAESIGVKFIDSNFEEDATEDQIISRIKELSARPNMCGIIVQLPLPDNINTDNILNAVPIELDVDALSQKYNENFYNTDNFEGSIILPTVLAISNILKIATPDIRGKKIAIVGQGRLVGKPLAHFLKSQSDLVSTIDKNTDDSQKSEILKEADIVISAVGKPNLINKDDVKDGVIIIDAGTMEIENTLVGDVNRIVEEKASFITPTPGGVGPMTVASLMQNVISVAKSK